MLSFPLPPPFSVSGSEDAESIARLRNYYQCSAQEYNSLYVIFERKGSSFFYEFDFSFFFCKTILA